MHFYKFFTKYFAMIKSAQIGAKLITQIYNTMTVEQKRILVRQYIKDGLITTHESSNTNTMDSATCDSLILIAENKINNQNNHSNNMNNPNIQKAFEDLQKALQQNGNNTSNIDENKVRQICENITDPLKDYVHDSISNIDTKLNQILTTPAAAKRVPLVNAIQKGNTVLKELAQSYVPNEANEINVMLLSPPSFGKTYSARKIGETYDNYIEHNCSEDIDEISNLIGSGNIDTSNSGKSFTVVDGRLVEAVRKASKGESTLLMLDEVLRWNDTTQSYFLTFLTGFEKTVNNVIEKWYRIRTAHNDKNNNFEMLECSAKKLHIICGANLGGIIPVEAFWSRFKKIRIEWNKPTALEIGKSICEKFGVDKNNISAEIDILLNQFVDAVSLTRELCHNGSLQFPLDFRHLERSIIEVGNTDYVKIGERIKTYLNHECANWNSDSGSYDKDSLNELEKVEAILNKIN